MVELVFIAKPNVLIVCMSHHCILASSARRQHGDNDRQKEDFHRNRNAAVSPVCEHIGKHAKSRATVIERIVCLAPTPRQRTRRNLDCNQTNSPFLLFNRSQPSQDNIRVIDKLATEWKYANTAGIGYCFTVRELIDAMTAGGALESKC